MSQPSNLHVTNVVKLNYYMKWSNLHYSSNRIGNCYKMWSGGEPMGWSSPASLWGPGQMKNGAPDDVITNCTLKTLKTGAPNKLPLSIPFKICCLARKYQVKSKWEYLRHSCKKRHNFWVPSQVRAICPTCLLSAPTGVMVLHQTVGLPCYQHGCLPFSVAHQDEDTRNNYKKMYEHNHTKFNFCHNLMSLIISF